MNRDVPAFILLPEQPSYTCGYHPAEISMRGLCHIYSNGIGTNLFAANGANELKKRGRPILDTVCNLVIRSDTDYFSNDPVPSTTHYEWIDSSWTIRFLMETAAMAELHQAIQMNHKITKVNLPSPNEFGDRTSLMMMRDELRTSSPVTFLIEQCKLGA
jgi:hypothetical protein